MKKICFFSPYLSKMHAGGGEKHLLEIALAVKHRTVFIAVTKTQTHSLEEYKLFYENFMGQNLSKVEFIWTPLFTNATFWQKLFWTRQFDELFYVTDGSLFLSLAKRNFLHIQIPFKLAKSSLLERLKLTNWSRVNTNSEFTKKIIERYWKIRVDSVLYPSVRVEDFDRQSKKEPIILCVGRFFKQLHSKRQDVLIECFKRLKTKYPEEFSSWQLFFVGGVEDKNFFQAIKKQANGLAIKFFTDLKREDLIALYNRSSFLWHAAGFGIDEEKEPEKVEHLGIVTLEAMAAGCVPLVVGKGGQKEVLGKDLAEKLIWQTTNECVELTQTIATDKKKLIEIKKALKTYVMRFSQKRFETMVVSIFQQ